MTGIRRLNHAVLFVSDLDRAERFYADVLGFTVVAREPRANAVFLRAQDSGNHHDLGLFGLGASAPGPSQGMTGLYHLAWQVDTIDELIAMRQRLLAAGALSGESSHGATKSLYAADSDGNQFEVMWMLPKADWGAYANAAPIERLDLSAESARWSGVGTADELGPGPDGRSET